MRTSSKNSSTKRTASDRSIERSNWSTMALTMSSSLTRSSAAESDRRSAESLGPRFTPAPMQNHNRGARLACSGNDGRDLLGGLAQWVVGEVRVSLSCARLGVTEQAPDDREAQAAARADARECVPQVVKACVLAKSGALPSRNATRAKARPDVRPACRPGKTQLTLGASSRSRSISSMPPGSAAACASCAALRVREGLIQ